jgi:deoxyadenosine/deoxycytidine kinase
VIAGRYRYVAIEGPIGAGKTSLARKLAERVARRGNPVEARVEAAYLEALAESYTRFFHQYDEAPVLTVNTEHLNPIDNDSDFRLLLDRIGKLRGRREYFNLAA